MCYDRKNGLFGQGKLCGLPFNTGGDVLYVNKQLFKEAGLNPPPQDGNWTIDDWLEMARREHCKSAGLLSPPAGDLDVQRRRAGHPRLRERHV
jgi:hypothetical protein